jgi:hypothetical protein
LRIDGCRDDESPYKIPRGLMSLFKNTESILRHGLLPSREEGGRRSCTSVIAQGDGLRNAINREEDSITKTEDRKGRARVRAREVELEIPLGRGKRPYADWPKKSISASFDSTAVSSRRVHELDVLKEPILGYHENSIVCCQKPSRRPSGLA